jgi:hypothetical protein
MSSQDADPRALRDLVEQQRASSEYLQQLAEQFLSYDQRQQRQAGAYMQKLDQHLRGMSQAAQSLAGSEQRLIGQTVQGIQAGAAQALAAGVQGELRRIQAAATELVNRVERAGAEMEAQRLALEGARRAMWWKLSLPLMVGTLMCALGGGAWLWFVIDKGRQAGMQAEFVNAINNANVQLCDGRLCVDIERREKRVINGGTYYMVAPR